MSAAEKRVDLQEEDGGLKKVTHQRGNAVRVRGGTPGIKRGRGTHVGFVLTRFSRKDCLRGTGGESC